MLRSYRSFGRKGFAPRKSQRSREVFGGKKEGVQLYQNKRFEFKTQTETVRYNVII